MTLDLRMLPTAVLLSIALLTGYATEHKMHGVLIKLADRVIQHTIVQRKHNLNPARVDRPAA
jgi:hypothetical protein